MLSLTPGGPASSSTRTSTFLSSCNCDCRDFRLFFRQSSAVASFDLCKYCIVHPTSQTNTSVSFGHRALRKHHRFRNAHGLHRSLRSRPILLSLFLKYVLRSKKWIPLEHLLTNYSGFSLDMLACSFAFQAPGTRYRVYRR